MIMQTYIGTVQEVLNPDLYTILVSIPGVGEKLKAFPKRGELDEPREGDLVLLYEADPTYRSLYFYEKLKEDNYIGIRARGKEIRMSEGEISIGIYTDESEEHEPKLTSWIKIDNEGNMDIQSEGNSTITINGGKNGGIPNVKQIRSLAQAVEKDITALGGAPINTVKWEIAGDSIELEDKRVKH